MLTLPRGDSRQEQAGGSARVASGLPGIRPVQRQELGERLKGTRVLMKPAAALSLPSPAPEGGFHF